MVTPNTAPPGKRAATIDGARGKAATRRRDAMAENAANTATGAFPRGDRIGTRAGLGRAAAK